MSNSGSDKKPFITVEIYETWEDYKKAEEKLEEEAIKAENLNRFGIPKWIKPSERIENTKVRPRNLKIKKRSRNDSNIRKISQFDPESPFVDAAIRHIRNLRNEARAFFMNLGKKQS